MQLNDKIFNCYNMTRDALTAKFNRVLKNTRLRFIFREEDSEHIVGLYVSFSSIISQININLGYGTSLQPK